MKPLFSFLLLLYSFKCLADGNIISGNTSVQPGSTETYTANWESWGSVYENYANVTWTVTGGTLLFSDKHTATIQWDDVPTWLNGTGSIEVYEDLGSQSGNLGIDIVNFVEGVSETCDGVLGPPVIAIDFGHGANPGPQLSPGATTYTYQPYCAVQSGEYSLTNTLIGCRSQWLSIPLDHTPGDIDGYMLVVDGNTQRGEVFRSTVSGLTNTFRYEFSAWVANLDDPAIFDPSTYSPPRVHFELRDNSDNFIKGSGAYSIPYDPLDPWKKISFMFDIPLGTTSLQVLLVNENGGADGNDFVTDDISFAPCYPPIIASFSPNPTLLDKKNTCNNGTINLYSWWPTPVGPYNNPSFQWQKSTDNGNTWVNISGATTMNYTQTENTANIYYYRIKAYETSNPSQFVFSNSLIYFVQKMVVDAKTFYVNGCTSSPTELIPNAYLQYSDPSLSLSYTYNWSPGTYLSSTSIKNPTITLPAFPPQNPPNPPNPPPPVNYFYTLTVQNTDYGCIGSNTQTVSHLNPRQVFIFNAFIPESPTNNRFYPVNIQDYNLLEDNNHLGPEFWIYNVWGQVIFHRTQGATQSDWAWDGKINGVVQPNGVYVWRLRIPGCPLNYVPCPSCDTAPDNPPITIHGTMTLIH